MIKKDVTKSLYINNISTSSKKDDAPLISNLFFKFKIGNSAIIFDNENEKKCFVDILCGRIKKFSGFINWNNSLFFSKNIKSFKNHLYYADISKINKNNAIHSIGFLRNQKSFVNYIEQKKSSIQSYNNYNQLNKFRLLFEAKKIDLKYSSKINDEIKKIIEITKSFIEIIRQNNTFNVTPSSINILNSFYDKYNEYLHRRINLAYYKNNELLHLILNDVTNEKNIKRKNLENKIKQIKTELVKNKIKDESQIKEFLKKIQKEKNLCTQLLKIQKNEFKQLSKKYKNLFKKTQNAKNKAKYIAKYYVNNFCYLQIKKNMKLLLNLNESQIKEFLNQIKIQSSILYFNLYFSLKNDDTFYLFKTWIINQKLNEIFNLNINTFINLSNSNKKNNNEILTKLKEDKYISFEKKNDWENNLINKKTYYQDLIDEYDWEHSNNVIEINEKFSVLNDDLKKVIQNYKLLRSNLQQTILIFINLRNEMITNFYNNKFETYVNDWLVNQANFKKLNHDYTEIYNLLKDDLKQINYVLENKIDLKKHNFNELIYKYYVYEKAYLCGLTITDLEKKINLSNNLFISKLLLTQSLLSNKEIILFDNLFLNLNKDEKNIFEELFNKISSTTNKIWINISKSYDDIKNICSSVNFVKFSKNVEFGDKQQIRKDPFYKFTYLLTKQRNEPRYLNRILDASIKNENYLNDFEYDFYKIDSKHYVYALINNVYEWTNKIPQASEITFNPMKIDEMVNKINQNDSIKLKSSTKQTTFIFEEIKNEKTIINIFDKGK